MRSRLFQLRLVRAVNFASAGHDRRTKATSNERLHVDECSRALNLLIELTCPSVEPCLCIACVTSADEQHFVILDGCWKGGRREQGDEEKRDKEVDCKIVVLFHKTTNGSRSQHGSWTNA